MFKALPLALALFSVTAQAAISTLPLGTDLNDVVRYDSQILHGEAELILASMQPTSPFAKEWFADGAFTQNALEATKQRWRGPVSIQALPVQNASVRAYLIAAAMLNAKTTEITIRRFKVSVGRPGTPKANTIVGVQSLASLGNTAATDELLPPAVRADENQRVDVPASAMTPSITAGLYTRIFTMKDEQHGIRFSYPLGVGGIDPGLESDINLPATDPRAKDPAFIANAANILTPTFEDARIERSTIWSHRNDQDHFRNEPFLRVMKGRFRGGKRVTGADGWTAVGFHITIMGDADYKSSAKVVKAGLLGPDNNPLKVAGPDWLTRGHDSHGCMRLRRNDLRFTHDLLLQAFESDKVNGKLKPVAERKLVSVRVSYENEKENNIQALAGRAILTEYTAWPIESTRYKRVRDYNGSLKGDCKAVDKGDGKGHSTCRGAKDHLVEMEQVPPVPGGKVQKPLKEYVLMGVSAEDLQRLGTLNSMAEGRDLQPPPPPCRDEDREKGLCAPIETDDSEMPALSPSRRAAARVPFTGHRASGAAQYTSGFQK